MGDGHQRRHRTPKGLTGAQARFPVYAYINAAIVAPTAAPASTTFVRNTNVLTIPVGYTATLHRHRSPGPRFTALKRLSTPLLMTIPSRWRGQYPVELPAYLVVALAEAAADRAEAGAALVDSYNGPVLITDAVAFTSDDTDIVAANWRDYDLLGVTFLDSSGNAETYQCLVLVDSLDVNGKAQIPVEQNAQVEITATDDSDSLNFNFAGAATGFPSTGDTISIWGVARWCRSGWTRRRWRWRHWSLQVPDWPRRYGRGYGRGRNMDWR